MKKKISTVQDFIPIRNLKHGIIETKDGRFLKILEIEPINFMLRSADEQAGIIYSFSSWLKIAPIKLQFKSITKRADCRKHIEKMTDEILLEESNVCKDLGYNYISLVKEVGNNQALTRRFFLIFEYEGAQRNDISTVCCALRAAEQNARNYFGQCGNSIIQPNDEDEATAEILYTFFNRQTAIDQSFTVRVEDTIMRIMKEKNLVFGVDEVPDIPIVEFIQPDEIDLTHSDYVVMDGTYYSFLYIKGDGYPQAVRANWMSNFINAGEGIDVDVFLNRENREKAIDKGGLPKTQFTRVTGMLFIGRKPYAVYNTRSSLMKWNGAGENKTIENLQSIARMNAARDDLDAAIMFYGNEKTAIDTVRDIRANEHLDLGFINIYQKIHFIPLGDIGVRQLQMFMRPKWWEKVITYLFEDNAKPIGYFNYDAVIDGAEILCFFDGDVTRLIRFKNAVMTNKIRYGIVCFPHQEKIIKEFFGLEIPLTVVSMEKVEKIISGEAE